MIISIVHSIPVQSTIKYYRYHESKPNGRKVDVKLSPRLPSWNKSVPLCHYGISEHRGSRRLTGFAWIVFTAGSSYRVTYDWRKSPVTTPARHVEGARDSGSRNETRVTGSSSQLDCHGVSPKTVTFTRCRLTFSRRQWRRRLCVRIVRKHPSISATEMSSVMSGYVLENRRLINS